jgi:hypothetical protein
VRGRVRELIVLTRVTWHLPEGVRALRALLVMLCWVGQSCKCQVQAHGCANHVGVYLDHQRYWLGINLDRPETLVFSTGVDHVRSFTAEQLRSEQGYPSASEAGNGMRRELDLASEAVHFFARSKATQLQVLQLFLEECLGAVRRLSFPSESVEGQPIVALEPDPPDEAR